MNRFSRIRESDLPNGYIAGWWRHVLYDQWCPVLAYLDGVPFVSRWVSRRQWLRRRG